MGQPAVVLIPELTAAICETCGALHLGYSIDSGRIAVVEACADYRVRTYDLSQECK